MTSIPLLAQRLQDGELRCDGCRHWQYVERFGDGAECGHEDMIMRTHVDIAGPCDKVIVVRLRTTADFGCVQWEAK